MAEEVEGKEEGQETLTSEQQEENQRLLDTEDESLSATEKEKKTTLLNSSEEKRILEADEKDLSGEDKEKKIALVKAKEEKGGKEAKETKEKAPDKYEDFTVPEGAETNQEILDEFKTVAKELNLSQEKAQALINLQGKLTKVNAEKLTEAYEKQKEDWKKETIKELGADHKKTIVFAERAIAKFGSDGLKKILNETGLGNQKDLVNFFVEAGKTISEDEFAEGKKVDKPKSDSELFYGDTMK